MSDATDINFSPDQRLDHDLLVSVMPDPAVVVDATGTIVSANNLVASTFGYGPGDVIGKQVEVLVPERLRHRHRQHRAEYTAAPRSRTMGAGLELYGRRRDGAEIPVDISLAVLPGKEGPYVLAAIRDISALKFAASSQAHLVAIVDSSLDGIISTSVDGLITTWNAGATRVLGYETDAVVGRHVSTLLFDDGSEEFEILLSGATDGASIGPLDTIWRRGDGSPVDVAISVSAIIGPNGGLIGYSAIVRDVTERKVAEAELRRLFGEELKREHWQAATSEIRLAMLSGISLEETLTLIGEHTRDLLDVESAVIGLVEDGELAVAAASGPALVPAAAQLQTAIVRRTFASGEPQAAGPDELFAQPERVPLACVPVVIDDRVAGVLAMIDDPSGSGLDPAAIAVLVGLAEQAALAIELGRVREDRDRLMLVADRERIARDLHDLVIQRLFAAGMALEGSLRLIRDEEVATRVSSAIDALDATVREIRTVIFELEEPSTTRVSLRSAILELAKQARESLGFEPAVRFGGPVDTAVDDAVRPHVLAAVREALSNAVRHARANRVDLEVEVSGGELVLRVRDDGVGLDPEALDRESGLANLRSRAEELGGQMELTRQDVGTEFVWRVPIGHS